MVANIVIFLYLCRIFYNLSEESQCVYAMKFNVKRCREGIMNKCSINYYETPAMDMAEFRVRRALLVSPEGLSGNISENYSSGDSYGDEDFE